MRIGVPRQRARAADPRHGPGQGWEALARRLDAGPDDEAIVDRAARLRALVDSEVWQKDLLPLLRQLFDETVTKVTKRELDSDALRALEMVGQLIDKQIALADGAFERLARRHYQQEVTAQAALEAQATP